MGEQSFSVRKVCFRLVESLVRLRFRTHGMRGSFKPPGEPRRLRYRGAIVP